MPISTITGKPEPTFDERVAPALGLGDALKEYGKGVYYNINPGAGPQDQIYEAVLAKDGIRQIALSRLNSLKTSVAGKRQWNKGMVDKVYNKLAPELANHPDTFMREFNELAKVDGRAREELVKLYTKNVLKQQAQGISKTPQVMLDTINRIQHKPLKEKLTAVGSFDPATNNMKLNMLSATDDVVQHEATHGLQHYWAHPNRMIEFPNMTPVEQARVYRTRYLQGPYNSAMRKNNLKEWYKKNYVDVPGEVNAREMAEITKTGKFSDDDAMRVWDTVSELQARSLAEKNPKFAKTSEKEVAYLKTKLKEQPLYSKISRKDLFRNSKDAMEWATHATPKDRIKLGAMMRGSRVKQESLKAKGDLQGWYDEATQHSLMRDAQNFLNQR